VFNFVTVNVGHKGHSFAAHPPIALAVDSIVKIQFHTIKF